VPPRTDTAAEFFEGLRRRSPEPLLRNTRGSIRIDLTDGGRTEHWLVSIDRGDLSVSRKRGTPDCVVQARRDVFRRVAAGRSNAMAAVLRGEIGVEGDPTLLVRFQRLLPSPPRQTR
jgi:putative sterol carrier protein